MRNKLIFGILIIVMVGSVAGITAYNTISSDPQKTTTSVGEAKKIDTKLVNIKTWRVADPKQYYGCMYGYLKDENGKPLANKKIKMFRSGYSFTAYTDKDGKFYFYDLVLGSTTTLEFLGDSEYNPCELSFLYDDYNKEINWE